MFAKILSFSVVLLAGMSTARPTPDSDNQLLARDYGYNNYHGHNDYNHDRSYGGRYHGYGNDGGYYRGGYGHRDYGHYDRYNPHRYSYGHDNYRDHYYKRDGISGGYGEQSQSSSSYDNKSFQQSSSASSSTSYQENKGSSSQDSSRYGGYRQYYN